MKKNFSFVIILLVSLLLVACKYQPSTDTKDWKSTQYTLVNNFEGISMIIKEGSITSTKLTVIFANSSNKQAIYSDDFLLEKKIEGNWYQVPTIIDDYGFNDIGYELAPSTNNELTITWDWLYGSLDTGEYRIIKKILDLRDTGDYAEYYLAATFTIN